VSARRQISAFQCRWQSGRRRGAERAMVVNPAGNAGRGSRAPATDGRSARASPPMRTWP